MMNIGLTCGAFDMPHAGHMMMFKEAKEHCDYLIVMLQEDPSITKESYRGKKKAKPIMPLSERMEILKGIRYIDEIYTYTSEEDLYKKLKKIPHHLRIVGWDWKNKPFTGRDLLVPVYYNSRNHNLSTTEIKQRIIDAYLKDQYNKTREKDKEKFVSKVMAHSVGVNPKVLAEQALRQFVKKYPSYKNEKI